MTKAQPDGVTMTVTATEDQKSCWNEVMGTHLNDVTPVGYQRRDKDGLAVHAFTLKVHPESAATVAKAYAEKGMAVDASALKIA